MAKPVAEYSILYKGKPKKMEISKPVLDYYQENK